MFILYRFTGAYKFTRGFQFNDDEKNSELKISSTISIMQKLLNVEHISNSQNTGSKNALHIKNLYLHYLLLHEISCWLKVYRRPNGKTSRNLTFMLLY